MINFIPSDAAKDLPRSTCDTKLKEQLETVDMEALEESSMLIENLSLDLEAARIRMATGGVLKPLVQFIEHATHPDEWESSKEAERQARCKNFDICKGALITALTTAAGEDRNAEVLWSGSKSDSTLPEAWFAMKLLEWIKTHAPAVKASKTAREDLVIAGTLCLGNLARRGLLVCLQAVS